MASYLRPRRGKKSTAESQITSANPLKRGEIFFEVPDTGVGTGTGRIKMGDGVTAYSELPYFDTKVNPDTMTVGFTNSTTPDSDPYTTNTTLATNVAPTSTLATIFTNIKKLILNHNSQLNTLNTVLTVTDNEGNSGNIRFAVDENGNYGYKKVGADTVTPFKSGGSGLDGNLIISSSDISEGDTLAEGTTYIYSKDDIYIKDPNTDIFADIVYNVELLDINTIDFTKTLFDASETYTIIMNDAVSNLKIGDIITINNDLCNEFVVIGKNHDGTSGTVDIMSRYTVLYGDGKKYYYSSSSVMRTWLNNDYLDYFYNTDVVAKFKTMDVKIASSLTNGNTVQDKVKPLSCVELNFSSFDINMPGYSSYKEGEPYTYFTAGAWNAANTSRIIYGGKYTGTSNATPYWLRTRYYHWYIDTTGTCVKGSSSSTNYDDYGILPVLRL